MPAPKTRNPQPRPSFARLEARIDPAHKELVQKAAALAGRSLTDFVVGCALQEAQRIHSAGYSLNGGGHLETHACHAALGVGKRFAFLFLAV